MIKQGIVIREEKKKKKEMQEGIHDNISSPGMDVPLPFSFPSILGMVRAPLQFKYNTTLHCCLAADGL